jgi:hypothetical protein
MPQHVSRFRRGLVAIEQMEVRAADRSGGDFDDRVRRLMNHRIGNFIDAHVGFAMPAECPDKGVWFEFGLMKLEMTSRSGCIATAQDQEQQQRPDDGD